MHLLSLISTAACLFGAGLARPGRLADPPSFSTFSSQTVYVPPANYSDPRVLYARTVELGNGVLLSTWENYSPEPPLVYFPIYKSVDGGNTWTEFSRITDQVNNWGLRYQPFLYRLPAQVGNLPEGTVLCAGNSIPTDLSQTKIDVYASLDDGLTWKFVSNVASGGAAKPDNGVPAIWEPFLLYHNGQLVIYFSDQRDPSYGQKLLHATSNDAVQWDPTVDDVHYPTYTDRPGMTTIAQLPDGNFIMTYEYGGGPRKSGTGYAFPVYYRINSDPLNFLESPGTQIVTNDNIEPNGSPYVVWSPVGGANGTIIVSSGSHSPVFVNQGLGDPSMWKTVPTPEGVSYTRHLRVLSDPNHLLIMGGGALPPSTTNKITVSVVDITQSLTSSS